jgi:hypothetical protein
MRFLAFIGVVPMILAVWGCGSAVEQSSASNPRGRYLGVGTYPAGRMWQRMVTTGRPNETAAAQLGDDEQIIVVVDSNTGEIRQCGNLTGHCIRMNPWGNGQPIPVNLSEHAADLDRAAEVTGPEPAGQIPETPRVPAKAGTQD